MAGFPIVSIESIVSSKKYTSLNDVPKAIILIPDFVKSQYYGSFTSKIYLDYYKNAYDKGYIEEIKMLDDDIDKTNGVTSNLNVSRGFTSSNNTFGESIINIKNIRIDSFYLLNIQETFFNGKTNNNTINHVVLNFPNLNRIYPNFCLQFFYTCSKLSINGPKLAFLDIGAFWSTSSRYISNIYFNTPTFGYNTNYWNFFANFPTQTINIYGYKGNSSNITNIFNSRKDSSSYAKFISSGTCTYSDFDVRYWSEEQKV